MPSDSETPAHPQSALGSLQNASSSAQGNPNVVHASPAPPPLPSHPPSTSANMTSAPSDTKQEWLKVKKGRKKGRGRDSNVQEAKHKQAEEEKARKEAKKSRRGKREEAERVAEATHREDEEEQKAELEQPAEAADATSPKEEVAPFNVALANARAIGDITTVQYPKGIICPPAEMNIHTKNGRFIYDRGFLLQFSDLCRESPGPGRAISSEVLDYLDKRPEGAERRRVARIKAIQMRPPAPAMSTRTAAPGGSHPLPAP